MDEKKKDSEPPSQKTLGVKEEVATVEDIMDFALVPEFDAIVQEHCPRWFEKTKHVCR